jgi:acetyl esterase/lipase
MGLVKASRPFGVKGGIVLLLLSVLSVDFRAMAQTKKYTVSEGIVYYHEADYELQLDLARPTTGTGPFPAIIFIHSGGWGYYGTGRSEYYIDIRDAAKNGFVAITIDYRLTREKNDGKPKYQFPDQVYDIKRAVRWLRQNASNYNIDPESIGAVGWSAGGHLALMLGLTDPSDGLEGNSSEGNSSSRIQAVVSIAGFSELKSLYNETMADKQRIVDFLGGTPEEVPERYKAASPLTYVKADNPPVMIIHGDHDGAAPLKQALLLDQKMNEIGVKHMLVIKKNGVHENYPLDDQILQFLKENLQSR